MIIKVLELKYKPVHLLKYIFLCPMFGCHKGPLLLKLESDIPDEVNNLNKVIFSTGIVAELLAKSST